MINKNYNPDVLNCLANLSNDEVFTPTIIVNNMLDQLPKSIWSNPSAKFLDPCTKTGVFLREIVKRLNDGLKEIIPDEEERINHILLNQIYGMAITEITSLVSKRSIYCSKYANGKYSVCDEFENEDGNVRFVPMKHTWSFENCIFCGANKNNYDRPEELESHAYEFIHTANIKEVYDMKFDVIIGNPPYQLSDGGGTGSSAMPLYQKFVEQAIRLNPRFLSMIIPSRWFTGGKGLDEFRNNMLNDRRLRNIVDYPISSDCFPGVSIKGGVCYFLWDRDNPGDCKVTTIQGEAVSCKIRPLLEENTDVFIRYNEAIDIYRKVQSKNEPTFMEHISARKPFGLASNFKNYTKQKLDDKAYKIYANKTVAYMKDNNDVIQHRDWVNKYKILITTAYGAGDEFPHQILNKPFLAEPGSICTETYIVLGVYNTKEEAENVLSYVRCKFFRFLVLLKKTTQNGARPVYEFVPEQDFSIKWNDEMLYKKYNLTTKEIDFIESMIKPISENDVYTLSNDDVGGDAR